MIRRALLLIGLLAAGCGRAPESDPAAGTKIFFDHLAAKRLEAAFHETAPAFQLRQPLREFIASARELGFDGCALVKADAPAIRGKVARQFIDVRTSLGVQVPLAISLVRYGCGWRVFSVRLPANLETGLSENLFTRIGKGNEITSAHDNPMPDESTARDMAKETVLRFHDAIQQKSFEEFYDGVARSWQRQLTLGMLTRTFQGFIEQRTDLVAIKELDAVLKTPPYIDAEGLLNVTGSYLTQPHRIDFDIKYFYEVSSWRPFGVAIRIIQ